MIVGAVAALFLGPFFLAGGVAVVLVGLLSGCAIVAVVVCRRPQRHRGLAYPAPMIVVVPVVLTYPMPLPAPSPQPALTFA